MASNREADIRVVSEIGSHEKLHTYDLVFQDEQFDLWQVPIPSSAGRWEENRGPLLRVQRLPGVDHHRTRPRSGFETATGVSSDSTRCVAFDDLNLRGMDSLPPSGIFQTVANSQLSQ
jgi:hypothetical protein